MLSIGAGSRGQGGQLPPGDILAPLGDFCLPETRFLGPFLGQKTLLIRSRPLFIERLFLARRRSKSGGEFYFLFLENACFWDKKTLQIRRRPFYFLFFLENACFWVKKTLQIWRKPFSFFSFFFLENACFWDKNTPISAKNFIPDFGALGLAPPVLKQFPRHWCCLYKSFNFLLKIYKLVKY